MSWSIKAANQYLMSVRPQRHHARPYARQQLLTTFCAQPMWLLQVALRTQRTCASHVKAMRYTVSRTLAVVTPPPLHKRRKNISSIQADTVKHYANRDVQCHANKHATKDDRPNKPKSHAMPNAARTLWSSHQHCSSSAKLTRALK